MIDYSYFLSVLTPEVLLWMVVGSISGVIIGALPGLGPELGIALFLPITFNLSPTAGLACLSSVFTSCQFGGNISAILINTPGTSDSIFLVLDGYPLTKRGLGKRALIISAASATVGGLIGSIILLYGATFLARATTVMGPFEIFLITLIGLSIIVTLVQGSPLKGLTAALLGLAMGFIGLDGATMQSRFTFGVVELFDGVPILPPILGLFAVGQMFLITASRQEKITAGDIDTASQKNKVKLRELVKLAGPMIRGAVIGVIIGIIPGNGGTTASSLSYSLERRLSKYPEEFGDGSEAGVASISAAINGVMGGSLVPLITLGIPGCSAAALFLSGLMVHGLYPGQSLFINSANIVYPFLFATILAQLFIPVFGIGCGSWLSKLTKVDNSILIPIIMVFSHIGGYAARGQMFDVYLMLLFGVIGFFWEKMGYGIACFLLAFVLGPTAETKFRLSLMLMGGNAASTIFKPLPIILILINLALILFPIISGITKHVRAKKS